MNMKRSRIIWQLYRKGWWKLWPYHNKSYDEDLGLYYNVVAFGPYQATYWSTE